VKKCLFNFKRGKRQNLYSLVLICGVDQEYFFQIKICGVDHAKMDYCYWWQYFFEPSPISLWQVEDTAPGSPQRICSQLLRATCLTSFAHA
jgi:hypothetical protein